MAAKVVVVVVAAVAAVAAVAVMAATGVKQGRRGVLSDGPGCTQGFAFPDGVHYLPKGIR